VPAIANPASHVGFIGSPKKDAARARELAALGHPFGAGEMPLPCAAGARGFTCRVDVEHDTRDLRPVGSVGFGIEKPQIGDEMLLVIILALRMCLMACGVTARRDGGLLFSC
jgi:hypothetical protein